VQAFVRTLPTAVIGILALSLAWLERGSIAAADWLPYAVLATLLLAIVVLAGAGVRPSRPALLALAALFGLALWAGLSLLWSPSPALARDEALLTGFYAVAFAIPLLTLRTPRDRNAAVVLVAAALTLLALAAAVSLLVDADPERTLLSGRLAFPVSYANAQAAMVLVGFWPAVALAASRRSPLAVRALACGAAAALLAVFLMTQSKGGGVALALSTVVVFALCPGRLRLLVPVAIAGASAAVGVSPLTAPFRIEGDTALRHALERAGLAVLVVAAAAAFAGFVYALADRRIELPSRLRRMAGAVVLTTLVAAVVTAGAAFHHQVDDPAGWLDAKWEAFKTLPAQDEGTSHFANLGSNRYDFWRVSLREFERHPAAGIGARGFRAAYLEHGRSIETPARAHSLPLDILLEEGVVGFFLLILGVGIPLVLAARRLPTLPALAAFGGGAYWIVHASADWIWTVPATGVVFFMLLGIAASAGSDRRELPRGAVLAAGPALIAVAVVAFAPPWLSHRLTVRALEGGSAPARLEWARRLDPLSVFPLTAEAALAPSPDESIPALERAAELEPRSVGVQYLLGRAYLDAGRTPQARERFRIAHRLYPTDEVIAQALRRAQ
jgi:tetratricopeptide (TPR) repeat protein